MQYLGTITQFGLKCQWSQPWRRLCLYSGWCLCASGQQSREGKHHRGKCLRVSAQLGKSLAQEYPQCWLWVSKALSSCNRLRTGYSTQQSKASLMFYGTSVLASHQLLHPLTHSALLVPLKQGQAFPPPPSNAGKSISQHYKTCHCKRSSSPGWTSLYLSKVLEMGGELPFPDTLSDDATTWAIITGQMFSAAAGEK